MAMFVVQCYAQLRHVPEKKSTGVFLRVGFYIYLSVYDVYSLEDSNAPQRWLFEMGSCVMVLGKRGSSSTRA